MPQDYEKHTPHTDALDTLGSILEPGEKRDAIHLAVEPVIAAQKIKPGQDVALTDGYARLVNKGAPDAVGIADPFLSQPVSKGDRFWLVVYPREIHSLRHVWEHPAFPPSGETGTYPIAETGKPGISKEEAERWLRDYLEENKNVDLTFNELMYAVDNMGDYDDFLYIGGREAHGPIPPEFWDYIAVYTGYNFTKNRPDQFSCSC